MLPKTAPLAAAGVRKIETSERRTRPDLTSDECKVYLRDLIALP